MAAMVCDGEAELVARARRDPQAFGILYTRHHFKIYRYAYARLRDHHAAEDVASEVFMKAFAAMPRFRPTGRPFLAWLYRIAANTVVDRCRRVEPGEPLDAAAHATVESSPESIAIQALEVGRLWILIEALPHAQRTALVLKFREDWSNKDIAAGMGRSTGATKVLVHRALTHVRARAYGIGEPL